MSISIIDKLYEATQLISNLDGWKVIRLKLTYLRIGALNNLKNVIRQLEKENVEGLFLETGCALGGSAIQMALVKAKDRKLNLYDVFGMIPPPSTNDDKDIQDRYEEIKNGESKGIRGDEYYGYQTDLKQTVINNLVEFNCEPKEHNITLIQGLYEETLSINEPVALAHIDCDWYSSVMTCLKEIEPNLSKHGIMIIDDYYDWSGCKKAIDEYFTPPIKANYKFRKIHEKLIIKRVSDR